MADAAPYTNGHVSPVALDMTLPDAPSPSSEDTRSENQEAAAASSEEDENADADGEAYHEDEHMEVDAESSEDAEGEADSDFGSDSPPPAEDRHRAGSSTSQGSSRPSKRKASVEADIALNPELYGLRRSVRGIAPLKDHQLTVVQGRARPTRRIVGITTLPKLTFLIRSRSIVAKKRMALTRMYRASASRPLRVKVASPTPPSKFHHC